MVKKKVYVFFRTTLFKVFYEERKEYKKIISVKSMSNTYFYTEDITKKVLNFVFPVPLTYNVFRYQLYNGDYKFYITFRDINYLHEEIFLNVDRPLTIYDYFIPCIGEIKIPNTINFEYIKNFTLFLENIFGIYWSREKYFKPQNFKEDDFEKCYRYLTPSNIFIFYPEVMYDWINIWINFENIFKNKEFNKRDLDLFITEYIYVFKKMIKKLESSLPKGLTLQEIYFNHLLKNYTGGEE
jgi:hypothetical protein